MHPLKKKALVRDHNQCQRIKEDGTICGRSTRLTMHHIIPKRQGGADELDNVVIWCSDCHKDFNQWEAEQKKRNKQVRQKARWTVEWKCKPGFVKCATCKEYACKNWPDGFVEALIRLLTTGSIART